MQYRTFMCRFRDFRVSISLGRYFLVGFGLPVDDDTRRTAIECGKRTISNNLSTALWMQLEGNRPS